MNADTIIQRKSDYTLTTTLGDELMLMHTVNAVYINLNKTGRIIWELTKDPLPVKEVVKELVKAYRVEAPDCELATLRYLQQLYDQDILLVH